MRPSKFLAPYAEDVVWNYGQYGLLGFLLREEIMQGIKTLLSLSSALQDIPPKDLVVGPVTSNSVP